MTNIYELRDQMGRGELKGTVTLEAATITGAGGDVILLDDRGVEIAVLTLGEGIDRKQLP